MNFGTTYCNQLAGARTGIQVYRALRGIEERLDRGEILPKDIVENKTCLEGIKRSLHHTNSAVMKSANDILAYHFPSELPQLPVVSGEESKRPRNFILGERLDRELFPELSSLISEYQTDCHTFTHDGEQCGMGNIRRLDGSEAEEFEFTDTGSYLRPRRSCRAECLGDFCPAWLNALVTKVPTRAVISVETNRGIKDINARINSLDLKIGPTKWTFDTHPNALSSLRSLGEGKKHEPLVAAGCRILQSGKELDLEAHIYLFGPPGGTASFELLPHTISFPELEGKRYFVPNNRWSITTVGNHAILLSARIHIPPPRSPTVVSTTIPSATPISIFPPPTIVPVSTVTGPGQSRGTKRKQPSSIPSYLLPSMPGSAPESSSSSSSLPQSSSYSSKSRRGEEEKWPSNGGGGGGGGGSGESENPNENENANANEWDETAEEELRKLLGW